MVAEDPLVHSGLASLLSSEAGFSVVSESDAELALRDVGPRSAANERQALERTPTLALVRDEDSALSALRAGALGVLLRSVDSERPAAR